MLAIEVSIGAATSMQQAGLNKCTALRCRRHACCSTLLAVRASSVLRARWRETRSPTAACGTHVRARPSEE